MNIKDLLDQDEVWVTADRITIALVEMDPTHRANTLAMLRRRADYQMAMYYRVEERIFMRAPDDVFEEWMAERRSSIGEKGEDWIERRPLIIALAELVRKDRLEAEGVIDGEVIAVNQEELTG